MTETKGEVYFEIITVGNSVKITAIDAESGTEAVTVGSKGTSVQILKNTAIKKLQYILSKKSTTNNQ